ncbi:MAG: hypothetical protein GY926_23070, partial [bacterium]|nr:hypothetical protein [bacterium]
MTEDEGVKEGPTGLPASVTVSSSERTLELPVVESCWTTKVGDSTESGCSEGFVPDPVPHLGTTERFHIEWPNQEWTFTASSVNECGPADLSVLPALGGGWNIALLGPAGYQEIVLVGTSDDASITTYVAVDNPVTQRVPVVMAWADTFFLDGDTPTTVGFAVQVVNASPVPSQATATLDLVGSSGEVLTVDLPRRDSSECSVAFELPEPEAREVMALLGDPPFHHTFVLDFDGVVQVASANWPELMDPETF